jgi:hypothetical protein
MRSLLLAGMLVMSAGLTTCKQVTDAALGPRVEPTAAGSCIKACADAANELMREESERHVRNVQACGKKNPECKQQEARRHQAAVQAIQDQRKACQEGCHHQGGGKGR